MSLVYKEKEIYVKTQFDEVSLEINHNNQVEVKPVTNHSGLKEFSENITSSIMFSEAGKTLEFFGRKDDGNI